MPHSSCSCGTQTFPELWAAWGKSRIGSTGSSSILMSSSTTRLLHRTSRSTPFYRRNSSSCLWQVVLKQHTSFNHCPGRIRYHPIPPVESALVDWWRTGIKIAWWYGQKQCHLRRYVAFGTRLTTSFVWLLPRQRPVRIVKLPSPAFLTHCS